MTKRDKELNEIIEAIEFSRSAISEADFGTFLSKAKQGLRTAGEKIGLLKSQSKSGINWAEVYRTTPDAMKNFVSAIQETDRNTAYDILVGPKGHPEVQKWALKNVSEPTKAILAHKKDPKNPELKANSIKAKNQIVKLLSELWAEADAALTSLSQTAASKPKESNDISLIANHITEDIKFNNGLILE
jgi:4-hydroxy-3-methylbut-2-enyl diphosphate reductase IspH